MAGSEYQVSLERFGLHVVFEPDYHDRLIHGWCFEWRGIGLAILRMDLFVAVRGLRRSPLLSAEVLTHVRDEHGQGHELLPDGIKYQTEVLQRGYAEERAVAFLAKEHDAGG